MPMLKIGPVDVCVLGAGIVGVSTAYWLAKAGKSVVVIDQLPGPGLDTSFANGGQISVSHAEPWANPGAPFKVLKWLAQDESPLLFRPRLEIRQWWWLVSWLVECLPSRSRRNTLEILRIAAHSRQKIQEIRQAEGFDYQHKTAGILHFYRDSREFEAAVPVAALMRDFGCDRRVIGREEILAIEPALKSAIGSIVGATYTPSDESGNAHLFTQELARVCQLLGVKFCYSHQIMSLNTTRRERQIATVGVKNLASGHYGEVEAGAFVLALGSCSASLASEVDIALNIYPAKGYSVTIPVGSDHDAPSVSLTDDQYKLVYSRLGDRLRVAGTAELSGYDRRLNLRRCRAILDNVRSVFPSAGRFDEVTFWSGLRPATPSNVPYIGRSPIANLYLNTGHGTLGWTMGPGSGHLVAEMICADRH